MREWWAEKMALLLFHSVAVLVLATRSRAQVAPPLVVFGDSTVDTGNNNYINTTLDFLSNFSPYGQDHFGKPTGRFTNGRVYVDYLCDWAGRPHVPPYLEPDADHSKGANFGSGGSGVFDETNEGLVISLKSQLKYFTEFQEGLSEKWGRQQANKFFTDAIYLISIGNNDYMVGYFGEAKLHEKYAPQDFIALVISEIIKACEFLHSKGARKFVVVGVGPLGCIPAVRQFHPTKDCFKPASDLAVAHNMALGFALKEWESNHPDVTLVEAQYLDYIMERSNNPTSFGLTDGVSACCGTTAPCGRTDPTTGETYVLCDNPANYVYWDAYHASEKMHEGFAKELWEGTKPHITPMNFRQLYELSSSPDCSEEEFGAYGSASLDPLKQQLEHSVV